MVIFRFYKEPMDYNLSQVNSIQIPLSLLSHSFNSSSNLLSVLISTNILFILVLSVPTTRAHWRRVITFCFQFFI